MDAELIARSFYQEENFCNSRQNSCKSGSRTFLLLPSFTWFLYLPPNILPMIVDNYGLNSSTVNDQNMSLKITVNSKITC